MATGSLQNEPPVTRERLAQAKDVLSRELLSARFPAAAHLPMLHAIRQVSLMSMTCPPELMEQETLRVHAVLRDAPPLVHAVGVGRKISGGQRTATPAVRIYVTHKVEARRLAASEKIPEMVNGVPTDVIVAPPALFLQQSSSTCTQNRTSSIRPLIGGISTSHTAGDTGTIGYFCTSTDPNDSASDVFVLSNCHIYGNWEAAQIGDDLLQPGAGDGGNRAGRIAGFQREVTLLFGGAQNEVDAAIGKLDGGIGYKAEICSIGRVSGTAQAAEDDEVAKHGRTTGYTEGVVDDELIDFIMLPNNSNSYIQFRNQMRIIPRSPDYTAIAKEGDSGSLVVKKNEHEATGLLHSAAIDGSYAYASHIDKVLSQLRIALL
jgi:hypothetical protein